jgi:hypothetical protein
MRRIGVLMGWEESDPDTQSLVATFRDALVKLRWTEGKNLRIELRWGNGNAARIETFAKELVDLRPDAILGQTTPVIRGPSPRDACNSDRIRTGLRSDRERLRREPRTPGQQYHGSLDCLCDPTRSRYSLVDLQRHSIIGVLTLLSLEWDGGRCNARPFEAPTIRHCFICLSQCSAGSFAGN